LPILSRKRVLAMSRDLMRLLVRLEVKKYTQLMKVHTKLIPINVIPALKLFLK